MLQLVPPSLTEFWNGSWRLGFTLVLTMPHRMRPRGHGLPLPYLWNEFWGDNLWFLSALRFNIQWSKLVCITDIFFSLMDEFAQMREQWVVKELMLKANMFLLPVGTLLMEVKLGQILLPTPLFPLCMTLLWTPPLSQSLNPSLETFPDPGKSLTNIKKALSLSSWAQSSTPLPSTPCRWLQPCDQILASGCQQKWRALLQPWPENTPVWLLLFLFTSLLTGSHIQGDLGSYVLKMMEPLPSWVPDHLLYEQKRNLYYIKPLKFGGLGIIKTNIILTKIPSKSEIGFPFKTLYLCFFHHVFTMEWILYWRVRTLRTVHVLFTFSSSMELQLRKCWIGHN